MRPSSARQPVVQTPKPKEEHGGYQQLVKAYADRAKAEDLADLKTPKKLKPHEPISTYADNFCADWSQRSTCKKAARHSGRVIDSARVAPSIPWHNVSSSNMQFLSKVDRLGGGRKLFHKPVAPATLGVGAAHAGQSV